MGWAVVLAGVTSGTAAAPAPLGTIMSSCAALVLAAAEDRVWFDGVEDDDDDDDDDDDAVISSFHDDDGGELWGFIVRGRLKDAPCRVLAVARIGHGSDRREVKALAIVAKANRAPETRHVQRAILVIT